MEWSGFTGERVSREHFWLYFGATYAASFVIGILLAAFQASETTSTAITVIWYLVMLAPSIFLTIGRMHDVNKSGWFALVPLYNIIEPIITHGDTTDNQFGPPPKQLTQKQTKFAKAALITALVLFVLSSLLNFLP